MKAIYYIRRFGYNLLPRSYFSSNYERLKQFEANCDQGELADRLNYYFKVRDYFEIPDTAIAVQNFKKTVGTDYYLDLKDFLHYFTPTTRFAYHFGDETHVNAYPTLFKARPLNDQNSNSILFKLNKNRHFKWVNDPYTFSEKKDMLVWRGGAYHKLRRDFAEKFWNHPQCNVGQTNKPKENVPWQKRFMAIKDQLNYKFICCPEGNDVATNLKWAMSSNSLCFMPKPRYETWFMEGMLKPGIHYVELKSDFSDLEEKINYYSTHHDEAEEIINNAHEHVLRFQNVDLEDLLCLKILERYTELSRQSSTVRP